MATKLVFSSIEAADVSTQTLDGREFLVVPVVAVKSMVLNGELLLGPQIEKSVPLWNDVPISITHPLKNGEKVSAKRIEYVETRVGRLYNAYYENERLKGEAWIDIEKTKGIGGDAVLTLEALERNEVVELSTAYYSDTSDETGTFNGVRYNGIQYNLRPDHLALLPRAIGACSLADGCGAPRVNEGGVDMLKVALRDGESYEMRSEAVSQAIQAKVVPEGETGWYVYLTDLYDNTAVYHVTYPDGTDDYMQAPYTVDAGGKIAVGDGVMVKRTVSYTPLSANVRKAARTPSYNGTETTAWKGPTLTEMIAGYVKHTGNAKPDSSKVESLPSAVKTWIASKTLLGDAKAKTARDLIFFPCVNPATNNLNEGALRAILGGRAAQANISKAAKASAQAKARSLLERKFGMKTQEDASILGKIKHLLGVTGMTEREKLVKAIRDNGMELTDEQAETTDEAVLTLLASKAEPTTPPKEEVVVATKDEPDAGQIAVNEYLKKEGTDIGEVVSYMKAQQAKAGEERQRLIDGLVSNESCTISKEALEKLDVNVLTELTSNFQPGSFMGRGVFQTHAEEVPASPAIVLATQNKDGE